MHGQGPLMRFEKLTLTLLWTVMAHSIDRPCDFARVDDRLVGLKAKNGYAMALNEKADSLTFDQYLYKFDLENNKRLDHDLGENVFGGEPIFVPKNKDLSEDKGWIIFRDLENWFDIL